MLLERMVNWMLSAIGEPSGLKTFCEEPTLSFLTEKRVMEACSER